MIMVKKICLVEEWPISVDFSLSKEAVCSKDCNCLIQLAKAHVLERLIYRVSSQMD